MRNVDDRYAMYPGFASPAIENTPAITKQQGIFHDGPVMAAVAEDDEKVTVERELVSQAEEEDMEALLGTYVMGIGEAEAFSERLKRELQALEAANVHAILENEPLINEVLQGLESATNCVEDMDEWLGIFNVKLRHMREDIESIETRNNKLEMQSVNNKSLIEELDKLLERQRIPSEYAACLTGGSFDEARMIENIEACEWLANALRSLEVPKLDRCYANMRSVREKRAELDKLRNNFVKRASEFLRNYFASLVDFMISDKSYFSQAREFANELRASTKASRNPTVWLDGSTGSNPSASSADTSTVSEAYAKMLTIFIPLLVDEEDFYAVVDWAYKIDPLRCISMHGITERYISGQKADAAGFVRILLDDLENRISTQFSRFVDEACHQIERNERNVRQVGVLSYIPRFATLATRMEQYIQGQSRNLVDQAYTKFQFERLFQFARRIEDLMYTITPEEVDKSISAMYKRLQKNLTSEELLPSLWDKCKKEFLDKYDSFAQLVARIYPNESIPAVSEMRDLLASM
ncbi:hypothetical protein DH2020_035312 [Rehmannia glutinosa]|uniref:Exocyst complex component Sec3 C-terminal domain-containing protein n=1 Tax=Rehmannia glutinosa TaxID=99300 RepID=A0ABR0V926_REHGL